MISYATFANALQQVGRKPSASQRLGETTKAEALFVVTGLRSSTRQDDQGILTQVNTERTMALGNEELRRSAVRNASADLTGFERELQVMGKGQALATASYRDIPLPTQAPNFDEI